MIKRKIAIVQLGRIGDMILITPLFKAVRNLFDGYEIHLYAGPSNYMLVDNNPYIDQVIVSEKSPFGIARTIFNLKKNKYDYWIDPKDHFSKESKILAKLARASVKIGFNANTLSPVFDVGLSDSDNQLHHTLIGLSSISKLNYKLPANPPKPELFTKQDSDLFVDTFKIENQLDNYVVLNISGSAEHKMWDNNCWIEFLSKVSISEKIVICFSPSERQRAAELYNHFSNSILFNSRNINDIVSLVSKCDYLISPDTSVVHIAAAFNKPVFTLYSGLDNFYVKFHPLSDKFVSVRAQNGDKGIKSITVDSCTEKFEEFLLIK